MSPEQAEQAAEAASLLKGHRADPLGQKRYNEGDVPVQIGKVFRPQRISTPLDRLTRKSAGRRSYTRTSRKRGRYVRSRRRADGRVTDLAFDATLREAAIHQRDRARGQVAFAIEPSDLREKVRVRRAANTILFVVDASWSMAAAERMKATKGAIMSLLLDAYQRRDRVGLVVFQKDFARLILPPTGSVELAKRALRHIPVGGKTPLSQGMLLAYRVLTRELRQHPEVMPLMILLTDGAGNVSMTELPAQDEALNLARFLKRSPIKSVVVNMEHAAYDRGLAKQLADTMGAPCYRLRELKASELYQTVRDELAS